MIIPRTIRYQANLCGNDMTRVNDIHERIPPRSKNASVTQALEKQAASRPP